TTNGTALMLTMPLIGVDKNGDGVLDVYTPFGVGSAGIEKYGEGKRLWYYQAGSSGDINSSGSLIWRAWTNDDTLPTIAQVDRDWSYYYGNTSRYRWNFIDSLSFSLPGDGSGKQHVDLAIVASALARAERRSGGIASESTQSSSITLSRRIFWRNWRK
ncbi:MAG TPA: hypothetical protein VEX38_06025, partial [Fimbriimonadaceae bacterium]|nr:hypothetical protein [Fimbriimonadaceae bacterium]